VSTPVLLVVALVQGALVLLLVTGLLATYALAGWRDRRRAAQATAGRDILERYLARRLLAEEARDALDRLAWSVLAALLHEFAGRRSGDDREKVVRLLEGTRWHRALDRQARSRFWWRRLRAARSVATLASPAHLLLVHRLLEDRAPAVRLAVATAIERLPSPGLASALLERAVRSPTVEGRHLVELLAESHTLVLPVMIDRLSTPQDEDTTRVLLDLSSRLGFTSLLPYIVPHASSPSLEIRVAAATCLRHFPHPQTSGALRRLLTDDAWEVRARAAASLGAIGAIEAIGDLVVSLGDPNWWVRLRSAIALRLVGPPGRDALERIEPSHDRFAHDMARYVLGLDDGAMAEYVGGATIDFSGASGALAG
jgi:HEAT repeat protein